MTTTQPAAEAVTTHRSSALAARDWTHVAAPLLAGVLFIVAVVSDPAAGLDDEELAVLYAEHTDALGVHALTLHFAYGLLIVTALFAVRLVRAKGAWIANTAAFLGFLGITTLPGLMFTDFISAAYTQELGTAHGAAVDENMEAMWGVSVFMMQGLPPAFLAPIVAAAALWRAGTVRWWAFAALLAAMVSLLLFGFEFWWGAALAAVFLAGYSLALYRAVILGNEPAPPRG